MSPQAGILVFDENGRLLLFASKKDDGVVKITEYDEENIADIIRKQNLPGGFLNKINRDGVISTSDTADGYFSDSVYLYATEITALVEKEIPPPIIDDTDQTETDGEESDSGLESETETESETDLKT